MAIFIANRNYVLREGNLLRALGMSHIYNMKNVQCSVNLTEKSPVLEKVDIIGTELYPFY